jgi:hypothetical protein
MESFMVKRNQVLPLYGIPPEPSIVTTGCSLSSPTSIQLSSIPLTSPRESSTPLASSRLFNDSPELRAVRKKSQRATREFVFAYLQAAENYLVKTYPYCFKKKSFDRNNSFNSVDDITNYLRWKINAKAKLKKSSFLCCGTIAKPKEVTDYYNYLEKANFDDESTANIRKELVRIIPSLNSLLLPGEEAQVEPDLSIAIEFDRALSLSPI